MLDGRIYRMSLVIPALALLVLAFSLTPQPAALHARLSPIAFNGGAVGAAMRNLALRHPDRAPGSGGDRAVAARVADSLARSGFSVSTDRFIAESGHGQRILENVVASRAGSATGAGSVLVVAPRGGPGIAGMSGTAMLMELGQVLGGEALDRQIVLASVSGAPGAAGALRLAERLPGPVDAVLVLGDVASARRAQPLIVPWGASPALAPARLRATLSAALAGEAGVHAAAPHFLSQLAHLAFPLTVSDQGPFLAHGSPAVELSLSGERGPSAGGRVLGSAALAGIGEAVLEAVTALDDGRSVGAPSGDVLFDGEIVPGWGIDLFVLALIVPVLLVLVDGLARARRRRHPIGQSLLAVLSASVPFLVAGLVLVLGGALGALRSPPGATAPGAVPLTGGGIAAAALALLAGFAAAMLPRAMLGRAATEPSGIPATTAPPSRPATGSAGSRGAGEPPRTAFHRERRRAPERPQDGPAVAMGIVLAIVALLLWYADPLAALLVVPALHLWVWAVDGDLAIPGGAATRSLMVVVGMLPTAAVVVFYGHALGFDAGQLTAEAVLLLAGHVASWVVGVEWALVLGSFVTSIVLILTAARRPQPAPAPVTVRGPLGYAGPGSLGGTKSALRR